LLVKLTNTILVPSLEEDATANVVLKLGL